MDLVRWNMQMEQLMKEIGKMVSEKDKEHMYIQMEVLIQDNGIIIKLQVKERLYLLMEMNQKVTSKKMN